MVGWAEIAVVPLIAWFVWLTLRIWTSSVTHPELGMESWTSNVTLPEQALWTGIPSYQRHRKLPVLTFATESAGLGDPDTLAEIARRYDPRPTDVHIVTYPKAGTSWIQEVVWLVNHNADIATSNAVPSSQRTTYIELRTSKMDKLSQLSMRPDESSRHIKWHHCRQLLPEKVVDDGKIIYLMRNPKDLVVSWYHFQRMNTLYGFVGDFDAFFELFLRGDVAYGSYWHNVLSWWKLRQRANVLFLTYEEMHADLPAVVRRVAAFLGKEMTPVQVAAIAEHCRFDQMRRNPTTNAAQMPKVVGEADFMRKGQVGDWRNYLSEEQNRRMEAWVTEHVVDERLPLVYDLK
jgi:hypothetical protein